MEDTLIVAVSGHFELENIFSYGYRNRRKKDAWRAVREDVGLPAHPAISVEKESDDVADPDFVLTAYDQCQVIVTGVFKVYSDMGPSAKSKRRQPAVEVLQDQICSLSVSYQKSKWEKLVEYETFVSHCVLV
ncbi:hypothetical protein EYF80_015736 [Liparis tanakae]|uniref:Uncharacterized protein n=1 Tax=Liparis tanakae TaxID=230148 RepID=A0A4Z2I9L6_9TELE|nr:hypothetical protein EYF80_015736 [Liparis tanakae]